MAAGLKIKISENVVYIVNNQSNKIAEGLNSERKSRWEDCAGGEQSTWYMPIAKQILLIDQSPLVDKKEILRLKLSW